MSNFKIKYLTIFLELGIIYTLINIIGSTTWNHFLQHSKEKNILYISINDRSDSEQSSIQTLEYLWIVNSLTIQAN